MFMMQAFYPVVPLSGRCASLAVIHKNRRTNIRHVAESEAKLRQVERYNRKPAPVQGRGAVVAVLQDEALDDEQDTLTASYLIAALGSTVSMFCARFFVNGMCVCVRARAHANPENLHIPRFPAPDQFLTTLKGRQPRDITVQVEHCPLSLCLCSCPCGKQDSDLVNQLTDGWFPVSSLITDFANAALAVLCVEFTGLGLVAAGCPHDKTLGPISHSLFSNAAFADSVEVRLTAAGCPHDQTLDSAGLALVAADWLAEAQPKLGHSPAVLDAALRVASTTTFGPEAALKYFHRRRSVGLEPTVHAANSVITACSHSGDSKLALEVGLNLNLLSVWADGDSQLILELWGTQGRPLAPPPSKGIEFSRTS
eukprot:801448-Pelagomonas_calceolata.AAC.3